MIEDDFKALKELIKEIQAGKEPVVSQKLWELAEAVIASKGQEEEVDIEKWAKQLAEDVVDAGD